MSWFILLSPVYLYHQLFIFQRHCFCVILLLVKPYLWNKCWTPKPGILPEGLYFSTVSPLNFSLYLGYGVQVSSVQLLSHVWLFATPWSAACQASLTITNSWSLLKLMSIESLIPSNHFILCCPLLLLPSIFPSIRVFSNESVLRIRWPKYWHFSFSINPSNECSGLISFKIDWFDLLAVQRTLKSLLWHHNTKASVLQHSAFSMVQLTSVHDYWINHSFDYMDLCQQSDVSAL